MERPIWLAFGIVLAAAIAGVIVWLIAFKPFDRQIGNPIGFWVYVAWLALILVIAYGVYIGF
jgi:hypothetical protein